MWLTTSTLSLLIVLPLGCKADRDDVSEQRPQRPQRPDEKAMCGDTECSPVPTGIKGLAFGMTISDIKDALQVTGLARLEPERLYPQVGMMDPLFILSPEYDEAKRVLPGVRVEVETTLGPEPATCVFDLAVDDKLSRIECTITSAKSAGEHEATVEAIRGRFEKNYGSPNQRSYEELWIWQSNEATLQLTASTSDIFFDSTIVVTNESTKHIKLRQRLQAEATRVFQRARAAAERAEEQAKRDKEKLHDNSKNAWDRDLLPPPESPH